MKPWVVVTNATETGRIASYVDADTEDEANVLQKKFGGTISQYPGGNFPDLRLVDGVLVIDPDPAPEPTEAEIIEEALRAKLTEKDLEAARKKLKAKSKAKG